MTKSKAIPFNNTSDPFYNVPTDAKKLNYFKKAQLINLILSYQAHQEKTKTQINTREEDVKALIKGIDQTNQDFISPSQYMRDISKRSARHSQEIKNLITDTKNTFKTVKRIVSLPSFI